MFKILQISIEVNSGSVGRIAEFIGQKMIDNGWDSYITYARNHLPSKSKTIKIGTKIDIYWHGIQTRLFDNHCLNSSYFATKRLILQIERIRPSIIILHHIHGYYLNMNVLFRYLSNSNIPKIWIFHDCWSFTGHCAHFENINCEKWLDQCFDCPQKKEYPKSIFLDRSRRNYLIKKQLFSNIPNMHIVSVSNWMKDQVLKSFLKEYPVSVINNGVNTEIFKPIDYSGLFIKYPKMKNKKIILGVASTWDRKKGFNDFFYISNKINSSYVIVLVGLNKKQMKTLHHNMIGVERTENIEELTSFYSAAEVFVNPTYEDTFPTTNIEALACGTPVITYNTGGSVESISEDVGRIVEKGDIDNLIEKIISIDKQKYTNNCRIKALEKYDKNIQFQQYVDLLTKLNKII